MNKNALDFVKSFLLWFCIFYLAFWAYQQLFATPKEAPQSGLLTIEMTNKTPVIGQLIQFKVDNQTDSAWTWPHFCNDSQALTMEALVASKAVKMVLPECGEAVAAIKIKPHSVGFITLPEFNTALFTTPGDFRMTWLFKSGDKVQSLSTGEFEVQPPGVIRKIFRAVITQPLFNALVGLIEILPTHSLGWAIVILTLAVRVILFLPNQKAMASQRKLQKLQPEMQAMRKKHGKNQQLLALETMALYKKHKINPMSSCWPMLLQMPFLIGIYSVVRNGLSPHLNHLLYSFHATVDLSLVDTHFFGLNLEIPNLWVLPVLVAGAQWVAIKLSMAAAQKQKDSKVVETSKKGKKKKADDAPDMMAQMAQMQKMMLWMLPIMIGVFTATFPAAVGIYWLTSTVFGIGQQKLVNWQLDRPQVRRKED